jgi:hypothetical protein
MIEGRWGESLARRQPAGLSRARWQSMGPAQARCGRWLRGCQASRRTEAFALPNGGIDAVWLKARPVDALKKLALARVKKAAFRVILKSISLHGMMPTSDRANTKILSVTR